MQGRAWVRPVWLTRAPPCVQNVPDELKHLAIQHLETNQDLASQTDRALVHCPAYIRNRILIHLYRRSIRRAVLLKVRHVMRMSELLAAAVFQAIPMADSDIVYGIGTAY